jgi:hypothetical protein
LQKSSIVYNKPGDMYALVLTTKSVLIKDKQKNSTIGLKDNKKD